MDEYGQLLYKGKTDTQSNSFGFLIIGVGLIIAANFIYAKEMLMIIGVVFILIGLYMLIFRQSEKFYIYEHVIVMHEDGQAYIIPKSEIIRIELHEMSIRRGLVKSYYPVLLLNGENQVLINKAFNAIKNRNYGDIIKSYMLQIKG